MIKFFRHIRQRLLTENKTGSSADGVSHEALAEAQASVKVGKYLKYAVGEIVLVVIGILIALQINNYNEWRKDRVKEKEILVNLAENFELNIETLDSEIESLQEFNKSSRIVLNVLDNQLPFVDSLAIHFHLARVPKTIVSLSQSGYEQYKNLGYDIILDKSTRSEIVAFFESTLPKWITNYNMVNATYVPFVDHHVPLFIYKSESLVPINIDQLYKDNYYLGWIRAYMEGRNTLIEEENKFIKENRRVLQVINDKLNE